MELSLIFCIYHLCVVSCSIKYLYAYTCLIPSISFISLIFVIQLWNNEDIEFVIQLWNKCNEHVKMIKKWSELNLVGFIQHVEKTKVKTTKDTWWFRSQTPSVYSVSKVHQNMNKIFSSYYKLIRPWQFFLILLVTEDSW